MPEENLDQAAAEETQGTAGGKYAEPLREEIPEAQTAEDAKDNVAFEEMLKNLDSIEIPQEPENRRTAGRESSRRDAAGRRDWEKVAPELDLDNVLQNDMTVEKVLEQENTEKNKGAEKRMDVKVASDETAVITAGMVITGDVSSEGSMDLVGTINGNIDILGKLNITGYINGNSKAAEIFAEGAKINGEILSEGLCEDRSEHGCHRQHLPLPAQLSQVQ